MKKIKFHPGLFAFILGGLLFTASCKKSEDAIDPAEQENSMMAAEDDAKTDAIYNTVFDDVMGADDEVGTLGVGITGRTTASGELSGDVSRTDTLGGYACLVVTRERLNAPALFPVKITYDFGAGCIGRDGHFRKGKIISIYTGRLIVPGSIATTTFAGYQIDSFAVGGTHIIKNLSNATEFKYEVALNNGIITNINNGKYFKREAVHIIKQIEGLGTPFFPRDDIFQITGGARGETNRPGFVVAWSRTILAAEPVVKRFTCHWFVKGKVKIERSNAPTAVLDYGDGNCDNRATITVNGATRPVILPW